MVTVACNSIRAAGGLVELFEHGLQSFGWWCSGDRHGSLLYPAEDAADCCHLHCWLTSSVHFLFHSLLKNQDQTSLKIFHILKLQSLHQLLFCISTLNATIEIQVTYEVVHKVKILTFLTIKDLENTLANTIRENIISSGFSFKKVK